MFVLFASFCVGFSVHGGYSTPRPPAPIDLAIDSDCQELSIEASVAESVAVGPCGCTRPFPIRPEPRGSRQLGQQSSSQPRHPCIRRDVRPLVWRLVRVSQPSHMMVPEALTAPPRVSQTWSLTNTTGESWTRPLYLEPGAPRQPRGWPIRLAPPP